MSHEQGSHPQPTPQTPQPGIVYGASQQPSPPQPAQPQPAPSSQQATPQQATPQQQPGVPQQPRPSHQPQTPTRANQPRSPQVTHVPHATQAPQAPHATQALPNRPHYSHQQFPPSQPQAQPYPQQAPLSAGQHTAPRPKQRRIAGPLLTGLALGAILGGLVGGGTAALVTQQTGASSGVVAGGGTIKLQGSGSQTVVSSIAAARTPAVVTFEVMGNGGQGSGSGVIIREDGYIVTNAHVVTLGGTSSDANIRVRMSDGTILQGSLVGTDPYADLAVVKVDAVNLPVIEFADSSKLNVGDLTVAIGAPLNLPSTVTSGVVSALNRGISVTSAQVPDNASEDSTEESPFQFPWDPRQNPNQAPAPNPGGGQVTLPVIQTDASINPGNSGGALLNGEGDLIGINVAIASTGTADTAGSVGLGFAVPSNLVKRVTDAMIAGETPTHGLLGANVADASLSSDASHSGGLIDAVVPGSAADAAGLRAGDVITAIEGIPAADGTSVSALVRLHEGGSTVTVTYSREGREAETEVTLGTLGE